MKYCGKCGNTLEDSVVFCPYCGANINDETNSQDYQQPVYQQSVYQQPSAYQPPLYQRPPLPTDVTNAKTMGVISLVAALVGILIPIVIRWVALVFGIIGLVKSKPYRATYQEANSAHSMSLAGVIISGSFIALSLIVSIIWVALIGFGAFGELLEEIF